MRNIGHATSLTFKHRVLPNDKLQLLGPGIDEARPIGLEQNVTAIPGLEPVRLRTERLALKISVRFTFND